ncbi:MAG TPA: glycosyltransferase family 2 protein [Flavobacteriaceae bacterium]|nr:glycosyltransferase family 2 protein [Flavobacteriaceae bacterium]
MKIAVVILNWDGEKLLQQFLPSVVKHSYDAKIYVADNASTDGSIEYLKTTSPNVKIIQNKKNFGFAKGYNEALKQVDADVFCLLNNDVEVTPNWLDSVRIIFDKEPNTAAIQPKILDYKNKDYFEYAGAAGGFIDKYGYPYCRGRIFSSIEKDHGQFDDNSKIFWASGACLFIRSEIFKKLNGFDEAFFAHMEEIDLCWRINNLGYDIKFDFRSIVYHVGGATLDNSNPKKTYLNFRNSLYAITKNAKGHIFVLLITRLFLDGIAALKFLINFNGLHTIAVLKSHFSFYWYLPKLIKQRNSAIHKKNYYKKTSIVWSYFVNKIKEYNRL